jgi:hypothetical protein
MDNNVDRFLLTVDVVAVDALITNLYQYIKKTPWPQSAGELYRPSDRRLSAKLVPTFCG